MSNVLIVSSLFTASMFFMGTVTIISSPKCWVSLWSIHPIKTALLDQTVQLLTLFPDIYYKPFVTLVAIVDLHKIC